MLVIEEFFVSSNPILWRTKEVDILSHVQDVFPGEGNIFIRAVELNGESLPPIEVVLEL